MVCRQWCIDHHCLFACGPDDLSLRQSGACFWPWQNTTRNDDTFVDWREMDGKPIRIVAKAKPIDPALYQDYLSNVSVTTQTIEVCLFTIVDGSNFNYQRVQGCGIAKLWKSTTNSIDCLLDCRLPHASMDLRKNAAWSPRRQKTLIDLFNNGFCHFSSPFSKFCCSPSFTASPEYPTAGF